MSHFEIRRLVSRNVPVSGKRRVCFQHISVQNNTLGPSTVIAKVDSVLSKQT